jgi:hypothetical protein
MTGVVVSDVKVVETPTGARLSARVRGGSELPPSLWFEVPAAFADALSARGDPFLPVLLLRALQRPGPIVIEAEVSPELLASARRATALLEAWGLPPGRVRGASVEIQAPVAAAARRGAGVGAFFSGGVDSFYTVLKNIARYPVSDSRSITHLMMLHGFDVRADDGALFERLSGPLREAAAGLGKGFLTLRTNLRELFGDDDFDFSHGVVLAGAGHAVAGLFHTLYIASSYPYSELRPWGSHPTLDPLWSSERVDFVHDGAERSRPEKIAVLARSPVALRGLRVCLMQREAYNCGKCEKCVRTMLGLAAHGVLGQATGFPSPLDPDDVERIFVPEFIRMRWKELCRELQAREPEVARAAARAIARSERLDAVWSVLSRLGLTRVRAKAIDRAVFRGAVLALWRRLIWGR